MRRLNTFISALAILLIASASLTSCKKKGDAPTADFSYSVDGQTVTFTFTGDGDVEDFDWDFGDNESATDENPTHTYAAAGTYTVTLKVSNADGDDETSEDITIEASAQASTPELNLGDADGAFYAINANSVSTVIGQTIVVSVASAVAWFSDGSSFVDVGTVTWHQGSKSQDLEYNTDAGTYTWVETAIPTAGFNDDGISWTIDGGNGFPSIGGSGLNNPYPFPSTQEINESASTISSSAAYTMSHKGDINDADSSYFSIYGPDATIMKRVGPNVSSVEFSAAEMATLGAGSAILQIASFRIISDESTTKKFYMVNESVASKVVTIE